jgi:hypothetical protein
MKKIIIGFILVVIIAAAMIYSSSRNILHLSDEKNEKFQPQTQPTSVPNVVQKKNNETHKAGKAVETTENNFAIYDQMEKKWLDSVSLIIGSKTFPIYLEMRERNDKEKMQAYKEYHDYLRFKYGDKYSYNISEDQSIREKKINERYLNDLLKLIGQEKFKAYLKAKDDFNEESRRRSKEAMIIEF